MKIIISGKGRDSMDKEFISYIREITSSKEFQRMKKHKHHINGTVYGHSVKVAYLCYRHHKRYGLKMDIKELIIGALLHDYYLYNLHGVGEKHRFHWFKHPKCALKNALKKYPDLTDMQRDMIKHHMFPLTPIPPKTKAGWLICFYDKVAAISDRFETKKNRKISFHNIPSKQ
ncbi:MAG: HD domain-containing protein [Clostridia bacterium]|nr:HD domain-containing protein [Clostridia bacterium]